MKYITQPDQIVSYNEAGELIAEVRFPKQSENIVLINRTFVDPSLRGQGVANELLVLAYDYIKAHGLKAIPTCSYAVTWFKRHPDHHDVLVKGIDLDNPELLLKEECAI
jgi:predicted GNAT family acetyltransferase